MKSVFTPKPHSLLQSNTPHPTTEHVLVRNLKFTKVLKLKFSIEVALKPKIVNRLLDRYQLRTTLVNRPSITHLRVEGMKTCDLNNVEDLGEVLENFKEEQRFRTVLSRLVLTFRAN